jgi:hypothetical protein
MADTIEVDLATLKRVVDDGLGSSFNGLQGCLPEISISTEAVLRLRVRAA